MVRLEDVARQVLGFLRDDLQTNAISVETNFRDGLPPTHADPTQLQQVILNLVSNAIEAMSSASGSRRLRLSTSISENSVLLSVQDSGAGIPRKDEERIFDAFFTTKASVGLGLAICRTLVENHGGVLRLAKADAVGSIFEVAMLVSAERRPSQVPSANRSITGPHLTLTFPRTSNDFQAFCSIAFTRFSNRKGFVR